MTSAGVNVCNTLIVTPSNGKQQCNCSGYSNVPVNHLSVGGGGGGRGAGGGGGPGRGGGGEGV